MGGRGSLTRGGNAGGRGGGQLRRGHQLRGGDPEGADVVRGGHL